MKEEKRRQEILDKRREEIREATEKFQRLNKNYTPGVDSRKGSGTKFETLLLHLLPILSSV